MIRRSLLIGGAILTFSGANTLTCCLGVALLAAGAYTARRPS